MKQRRPLKPCKGAVWNAELCRWELGKGTSWPEPNRSLLPRSTKPLPKRKKRKLAEDRQYDRQRKWFLARPDNSACPVAGKGFIVDLAGELRPHHRATTSVHHAWRRGIYYLEESTWLAVSAEGHRFIEDHPEVSRLQGWLADTADTRARWRRKHGGMPLK